MKKKLLFFVVIVATFMCLFAFSSSAVVPTVMGDCIIGEGEDKIVKTPTAGLDYTILDADEKTATLSGNGGITSGEIVIASTVVINGETYTVTRTNAAVFKGSSITAIYVPNTVKTILGDSNQDNGTFANCKSLSEVYIGTGIETFGRFAFTSIGATTGVSKFIVKGYIKEIGEYAFNCANFNSDCEIECDTSRLEIIEARAFWQGGKALKVINSPVLKSVGAEAFKGSPSLEYILIPENCTIGTMAFNGTTGLKTVIIRCAEGEIKQLPQETFSSGEQGSIINIYIDGSAIATGNHILADRSMNIYFEKYEYVETFVQSINSGFQGSGRISKATFYVCNANEGNYKFTANTSSVITPTSDSATIAPHAFVTKTGLVLDATCSTSQKTYDVCEICDAVCNEVESGEVNPNAHKFETIEKQNPTCVKDGYEILKCTLCSYVEENLLERLGHDFVAKVKVPTCTSIGYTTYTCKTCNHTEIGDKTPKNDDHTYVSLDSYITNDGKIVSKTACVNCGAEGQSEEISLLNKTYIKDYKNEIFDASEGLSFTYDAESKTATVTGGTLASTDLYIPAFVEYNGEIYKVTTVANKAFQGVGLTKVFVPDTVTALKGGSGTGCFGNNTSLTTIVVGSGVTVIEQEIFSMGGKTTIEEFIFKGTITSIGSRAFNYVFATDVMTGYEFNTRLEYIGEYIQGSNNGVRANLIKEVYITYNCDISSKFCLNGAAGLSTVYLEGGKTADTAKILTQELFSGDARMTIYIKGYVKAYVDPNGNKTAGQAVLPSNGAQIYMQSQDAMKVFVATIMANEYSSRAGASTWYDCETQTYFKLKTTSTNPNEVAFNTSLGESSHLKLTTIVDPTCTSEGVESVDCFMCSKNFKNEVLEKIDHIHTNEQITNMPSCKDKGSLSYTCASCGEDIVEEIAIDPAYHNYSMIVLYTNGFDKDGEQYKHCSNCDDMIDIIVIAPIFTPKGYSMNNAQDQICATFEINIEMLENYKKYNDMKFGIMIGNAQTFQDANKFIVDGVMKNPNGIQLEIKSDEYASIKCTITGYAEEYDDLQLIIALYVIDNDGNVSYIQKAGGEYYVTTVIKDASLGAFTRTTIRTAVQATLEKTSMDAILPNKEY